MDVVRTPHAGWIEVIVGSMFSGKSEELIRRLRRAQIARQRVQIFKPAVDTRYAEDHIVSHSELRIPSEQAHGSGDLVAKVKGDTEVVGHPLHRNRRRQECVFRRQCPRTAGCLASCRGDAHTTLTWWACETLASSLIGDRRPIVLEVHAQDGIASSGSAVSIGLIVTELVLNSLKHAFPDEDSIGNVLVAYDVSGTNWRLTVSDNGVGRPDDSAGQPVPGLGTNIIEALAKQLDARVEALMNASGTTVTVTHASFPSRLQAPETAS